MIAIGLHERGDDERRPNAADLLAAFLRGDTIAWTDFGLTPADFLRACDEENVTALVHERACGAGGHQWPLVVQQALAPEVHAQIARELVYARELRSVLQALAAENMFPILIKGAALAYGVYSAPFLRPRIDTDLLIARDQVPEFRRVMAALGYTTPLHCDGEFLFCQFPLVRADDVGVFHRFDCHWKISTQPLFANVLTYDEVTNRTIFLPALGRYARTLEPIDALLLACVHPTMHHRNVDVLIWAYDIHLLASSLSQSDLKRFAEMAVSKQVAAVCAHQLEMVRNKLGTSIPESVMYRLCGIGRREPSAVYLRSNRQWIDEFIASVRGLPRWRDRLRLAREVLFPAPAYMLEAYGYESRRRGVGLLAGLYLHRLSFGAWKVITARK